MLKLKLIKVEKIGISNQNVNSVLLDTGEGELFNNLKCRPKPHI